MLQVGGPLAGCLLPNVFVRENGTIFVEPSPW